MPQRRARNRRAAHNRQALRSAEYAAAQLLASKRGANANIFNWLKSNPDQAYYDHPDWYQIFCAHDGTGDEVDLMVRYAELVRACQRRCNTGDPDSWREVITLAENGMKELMIGDEIRDRRCLTVLRVLLFKSTAHHFLGEHDQALADVDRLLNLLPEVEDHGYDLEDDPVLSITLWAIDVGYAACDARYPVEEGLYEDSGSEDLSDAPSLASLAIQSEKQDSDAGSERSVKPKDQTYSNFNLGPPSFGHPLNFSTSSSVPTFISETERSEASTRATTVGSSGYIVDNSGQVNPASTGEATEGKDGDGA